MTDQAEEGLLSPYLRSKRIGAALPFLKGRILDYGCGSGALAAVVKPDRYVGVDVDRFVLNRARNNFPQYFFIQKLPATVGFFIPLSRW